MTDIDSRKAFESKGHAEFQIVFVKVNFDLKLILSVLGIHIHYMIFKCNGLATCELVSCHRVESGICYWWVF